jgi:hypothetical protein
VVSVNSAIFASAVSTSGRLSLTYRVGIQQGARHVRSQHQVSGQDPPRARLTLPLQHSLELSDELNRVRVSCWRPAPRSAPVRVWSPLPSFSARPTIVPQGQSGNAGRQCQERSRRCTNELVTRPTPEKGHRRIETCSARLLPMLIGSYQIDTIEEKRQRSRLASCS